MLMFLSFAEKMFGAAFRPLQTSNQNKILLFLQMQHAVLDLLRAALVPELGADITAGAAGDVQLVLVAVAEFLYWSSLV